MLSSRSIGQLASAARANVVTSVRPPVTSRAFHLSAARRIVHNVKTAEEFQKAVTENDRVIVDCFATWCGPCKAIAPILEKHSEDAVFKDRVHFVKFDVDELPAVTQALGVRAMPTFFFFKNGKKFDEMVGANPPALLEALKKIAA
ncbi:thioredoxin trx1 [Metarhizium acridum]|uniref:thioredoxin trx1 n=1 Tax=Metarhizium acridum TaxID=92637 RepID=UPI001C6B618A|nr:thioredoxin trx1 [Metarhizium acridum]KAG8428622.1 thioredoxin trx1 [Metarhizium acridum]